MIKSIYQSVINVIQMFIKAIIGLFLKLKYVMFMLHIQTWIFLIYSFYHFL